MANQNATIEWWEKHRFSFHLFILEFVIAEAGLGNPEAAQRRLAAIAELPELLVTEETKDLANALITNGPIPEKAEMDAYHISVATTNGMEYLLIWNCTHIANALSAIWI
jgi:hypothetical protein